MNKEWFVIHAYSGYEFKVQEALLERIKLNNMEDSFGDIMIPAEEVIELKGGVEKTTLRKFFPGYVLVNMEFSEKAWHLVKDTPRVMGFVGGTREKPSPITEAEAKGIMNQIEAEPGSSAPKITFEIGEMVRVIEGPFNDFSGVIEEVNYEKSRVKLAVLIFGRSTPVELEFNQIEKG